MVSSKEVRKVGAWLEQSGTCRFRVWAPLRESVALEMPAKRKKPMPLEREDGGYWSAAIEGVDPGDRYRFMLDGGVGRPDPASFYQVDGVHEPSAVVDLDSFKWTDDRWRGTALRDLIIYELHTGTFTSEGTFDGIVERLGELVELGVTAVEIMPIAQFSGSRNWGYDGVHPFAVQNSYGGPNGLARLVNACHERNLAVILDVVYNHLGPEGNYLGEFGPYFTDRYRTPWGDAVNLDGPWADQVRGYFIQNALHWLEWYHIDGLRIDAIHGIYDSSAKHFLAELTEAVERSEAYQRWPRHVIAESDLNDVRTVRSRAMSGLGMHAQWNDDFHHALHTMLTHEQVGYYDDFGRLEDLEKAFRDGFVYDWRYSRSRVRHHGSSSAEVPGEQLVVFCQNHD
ncbi:MAG: malto-oligosyltrehalose trehalohydrolase, partial [Chitinivibrionales bacterium]|nr:malto-oligosyltrehalose trehalohydrolase [Chitinivibrionales bacterium]